MSLPEDSAPPGHIPPASTPPWPLQPPPHGAAASEIPVKPRAASPALGPVGAAIIGGTVAAIGLAFAIPWLRREFAQPTQRKRTPARKSKRAKK